MTSPQAPAPAPATAPASTPASTPAPPPARSILEEKCSKILCASEQKAALACSNMQDKVAEIWPTWAAASAELQHYQAGLWGYYPELVVDQQEVVDELHHRLRFWYDRLRLGVAFLLDQTARRKAFAGNLAPRYQAKVLAGTLSAMEEATARRLWGELYVVDHYGGWTGLFRLHPEESTAAQIRRRLQGSCLFAHEWVEEETVG